MSSSPVQKVDWAAYGAALETIGAAATASAARRAVLAQVLAGFKAAYGDQLFAGRVFDALEVSQRPAGGSTVLLELTVGPAMMNALGTFHGACSAFLVDMCTSMAVDVALMAKRGAVGPHVSVALSVDCVSAAARGDRLLVTSTVDRVGGSLAFSSCTIAKIAPGQPGRLVASGKHTKFLLPAPKL